MNESSVTPPVGCPQDFSKSFMYSMHQLCSLTGKHLDQLLTGKKSLSFSQFMILVGFQCSAARHVSQSEIAEQLSLTEATVSRHISTLVDSGYITRTEDKGNRRKHIITINNKGAKAFEKTKALIEKELDDIFSPITEKDRINIMNNFSRILTRLLAKK